MNKTKINLMMNSKIKNNRTETMKIGRI